MKARHWWPNCVRGENVRTHHQDVAAVDLRCYAVEEKKIKGPFRSLALRRRRRIMSVFRSAVTLHSTRSPTEGASHNARIFSWQCSNLQAALGG